MFLWSHVFISYVFEDIAAAPQKDSWARWKLVRLFQAQHLRQAVYGLQTSNPRESVAQAESAPSQLTLTHPPTQLNFLPGLEKLRQTAD